MTDADTPQAFPVLEIRQVRAADADEALSIAQRDLDDWAHQDPGIVGATAGGEVVGLLEVNDPEDAWLDPRTANQALVEAGMALIRAAQVEGDDGTGGVSTLEDIERAILWAAEAVEAIKGV